MVTAEDELVDQPLGLMKELWAYTDNRISVRFEYEWRDGSDQWYRTHGNEVLSYEGRRRGLADQQEHVCREGAAQLRGALADRRGDGLLPRALQGRGLAQAAVALA